MLRPTGLWRIALFVIAVCVDCSETQPASREVISFFIASRSAVFFVTPLSSINAFVALNFFELQRGTSAYTRFDKSWSPRGGPFSLCLARRQRRKLSGLGNVVWRPGLARPDFGIYTKAEELTSQVRAIVASAPQFMTLETVTAEEDGRAPFAPRFPPWVHCVSRPSYACTHLTKC